MTFWTYMLHCNGGYFYVGHTDDLERRMTQHTSGALPGFSRDHLPVRLVWQEAFQTRLEALEAERRVKGWRKDKKLALIRGDWNRISALAALKKDSASTGSAQTGIGAIAPTTAGAELVEALSFHSSFPPTRVHEVTVRIRRDGDTLRLSYCIADTGALRLTPQSTGRSDGLWRTTCFEAFVASAGPDYREFNFAPSGAWAAYAFDTYRTGMRDADAAPVVGWDNTTLTAEVAVDLPGDWRLNLSAVIEETDGTKSFWALAHPPGPPDFHHPDCFVLELPAVG